MTGNGFIKNKRTFVTDTEKLLMSTEKNLIKSKGSKIQYDENENPYVVLDGNRIVWITNVKWIENLMKLIKEENEIK